MLWYRIKIVLCAVWNWVKHHPIITVVALACCLVVGTVAMYEALHLTSMPGFCRFCHPEEKTGPLSEYHTWSKNVHSFNEVECLDCHSVQPGAYGYVLAKMGGMYDLAMEFILNDEKKLEMLQEAELNKELVKPIICLHCHSDATNNETRDNTFMTFGGVAMRELDTVKNPEFRLKYNLIDVESDAVRSGVEPNHGLHVAQDIACIECHAKVSHSGDFKAKLDMQTCFTCHDQKRAEGASPAESSDCEKCHVNQVKIQEGTALSGQFDDAVNNWNDKYTDKKKVEPTRWSMRDLGCEGCHADQFTLPEKENCDACHEAGYGDMMTMWQDDYNERNAEAFKFIADNMKHRSVMTPEQLDVFNRYEVVYDIVAKDGSKGVHNPDHISEIFDRLEKLRGDYYRTK